MSQSDDLTEIKVAIGVLQSQNAQILKRQDSMERKIDDFAFVKQGEFNDFKKDIKENYATKEELGPMKKLFYAIVAATVAVWIWLVQTRGPQ